MLHVGIAYKPIYGHSTIMVKHKTDISWRDIFLYMDLIDVNESQISSFEKDLLQNIYFKVKTGFYFFNIYKVCWP